MTSRTTPGFRAAFGRLPAQVQIQCRAAYRLFLEDPRHRSLRFKKVHGSRPIYSVRVSRRYRALGIVDGDEIEWFWVGTHADYDQLLGRL